MYSEIWKPMYGFEKVYEINRFGIVRRISNRFTTKICIFKNDYNYVYLYHNRKRYCKRLCRLVALTFLGVPPEKYQVNHKNGIKNDDRLTNLEWVTQSENMRHAIDVLGITSVHGECVGSSKLTEKNVIEIRKLLSDGCGYAELGRKYNVHRGTIYKIKAGETWKYLQ